jgi:Holliday junction DNA helicase RuvA
MIGFLRGRLTAKQPPQLVIDVGGVGYEVEAPMPVFYDLPPTGSEITLFTQLIVREDAHILFGFRTERDRRLFRELLKVSNVGPKLALALLSGMSVDNFIMCIEAQDIDTLVRIPGVGRKTAERLVVEMRDRVKGFGGRDRRRRRNPTGRDRSTGGGVQCAGGTGLQARRSDAAIERRGCIGADH